MSNELLTAISAIKLSVIKKNFREKDERVKVNRWSDDARQVMTIPQGLQVN